MRLRSIVLRLALRLVGAALVGFLDAHAASSMAATLRPYAELHGSLVHLSDLFAGLELGQDVILGKAPEPGSRLVIGHAQLEAIAAEFNVAWDLTQGDPTVVLERPGHPLEDASVTAALRSALATLGVSRSVAIDWDKGSLPVVDDGSTVGIRAIGLDGKGTRFSATVEVASDGRQIWSRQIAGRITSMSDTVVAARWIAANELLRPDEVAVVTVSSERRASDAVTRVADLAGLMLRSPVSPGQSILRSNVKAPDLVATGSAVLMRLSNGGIDVTAEGRALESGGRGDQIHVLNPSSKAILVGWITASNEVRIDASSPPSFRTSAGGSLRIAGP